MKAHTSNFKEQIKLIGRDIDSKITFGSTVLGKNDLNAVTPSYQGAILKSVMKQLDIDSNVEIPIGTILNYQFGLKVNNDYEYIDFGNYIVKDIKKQEDSNSYKITCYDKILFTMKDYISMPISYPINIRDYINAICVFNGLTFANYNDEFANYDKIIQNELYLDVNNNSLGYTFRDVLDELSEVTAGTICINENDELEIRYINETNDIIDEEFLKDVNVNFGEKFGAINTIVLSRSGDSDNIYYPENLPDKPYEFKITDNQIMNFNDRNEFLPDIYEKLNGLEFYTNDFVSTGICYYDLCDRYFVKIGNKIYSCIMLNNEVLVTQGLQENIYTEMPKESETDYKYASSKDATINQAYIIAKKTQGEVEIVTQRITEIGDSINDIYTKNETNELIIDTQNGLTNTFSQTGGQNLLFNAIGNFGTDYWQTTNVHCFSSFSNTYIKNKSGQRSCFYLNNGNSNQTVQVANGIYVLSGIYEKLIPTATHILKINGIEYDLLEEFEYILEITNNSINVEILGDVDESGYLMNLMLNKGNIKQEYSNNANETITDTVKIGKGIQIEATGSNSKFDAQADGIRIIDINTNQTSTEFTDKGTITKNIESDGGDIANLLIKDTGSQTWLTRL